jgi:protein-tyrosine phosphatase
MSSVLFLCTGNAARSVFAGAMLASLRRDIRVETAGTHTIEGLPMSWRTRDALAAVGLSIPAHRSTQATTSHLDRADVVVALAPEHVAWVRRQRHPARTRTSTLKHLASALTPPGPRCDLPLAARLPPLLLATRAVHPAEEVTDPAGHEVDAFIACAREVAALVRALAKRL